MIDESLPAPPPPEPPPLSRSERLFFRLSLWQTVLSVLGVFVGAVALYAALTESDAVRRQTAASVWPYVQLTVNDYANAEGALFEVTLTNAGVGPAQMRAVRVTINQEAVADWQAAAAALDAGDAPFAQSFAVNRVIRAGETVTAFSTHDRALVARLRTAAADGSAAIEYCYCSIFEACWVRDSRAPNASAAPVAQCPDYGAAAFQH